MAFTPRIFTPGRDHFFLLGPRGTGKTLWCAHEYPDALRIDLLDPAVLRQFSPHPERLTEVVAANSRRKQIVIDEIQKLPELLEVVHLLIERKTNQQFILTGSSARNLHRHGVNLLGGRAAEKHLHPYMAAELGNHFQLSKALHQGMTRSSGPQAIPTRSCMPTTGSICGKRCRWRGSSATSAPSRASLKRSASLMLRC